MSYINYRAVPVHEMPNQQNKQNVERAMTYAANTPVQTSKMEAAYAAGREEEGREEENKVKSNICKDYETKLEAIEKKYQDEHKKVDNELKGQENKQAHNDLNNKCKAEKAAIEKEYHNNIKVVESRAANAKGQANAKNENVERSR